MAIADAAGFVFAAPDELGPVSSDPHLEQAFRNGHRAAARKAHRAAGDAVAKIVTSKALVVAKRVPHHSTSWLQSALGQLKPRRMAA